MIIELLGLPGSGKSTLARELAKLEDVERVKIKTRAELVWYNFLFFCKNPLRFLVLFNFTLANLGPKPLRYYKFVNTFLQHNAKYQKAKKFRIAVVDQGHLQNFLSLFENRLSDEQIKLYLKKLPKVDKILVMDISDELRQQRLINRGYSPRENMDKNYLEKWQKVIIYNFDMLKNILSERGDVLVVVEDNLSEQIKNICEKIKI